MNNSELGLHVLRYLNFLYPKQNGFSKSLMYWAPIAGLWYCGYSFWRSPEAFYNCINSLTHSFLLISFKLKFLIRSSLKKLYILTRGTSEKFCYKLLEKTSRSFAAVTLELKPDLDIAVATFYLTLRALDSIEDNVSISTENRAIALHEFPNKLKITDWNIRKGFVGLPDFIFDNAPEHEVELLDNFEHILGTFQKLREGYVEAIHLTCSMMANGMAEFLEKEIVSLDDYDRYCYYVAGTVGIGLTRLFNASRMEELAHCALDRLGVSMGLFLQKTNIIRDYLEDISQSPPRIFYPREIWSKYVDDIKNLGEPYNREKGVFCVNELITNALESIFDCLDYLHLLRDFNVFRFCGIPQCMAIATLETCYQNSEVLNTRVKMSRSDTLLIMATCNNFSDLLNIFDSYLNKMLAKIRGGDPNEENTRNIIYRIRVKVDQFRSIIQPKK